MSTSSINPSNTTIRELTAFAATFPEAAVLVEHNPALALCLSHLQTWDTAFEKGDPDSIVRRLLYSKRRVAAEFLGFPGDEAVVKLLAKIPSDACYLPHLMRLRRNLRENRDTIRLLSRLPVFDEKTLFLAAYWRWGDCVAISYFLEIADACSGKDLPKESWLLDDTISLVQRLGKRLRLRFPNRRALRRFHDRLTEELNAKKEGESNDLASFPPPPKPGTAGIVPLDRPDLLIQEGRLQHHCAAIYEREAATGHLYFYRVLQPERATLCLSNTESGWVVRELRGACNSEVGSETRSAIERWLSE